MSDWSQDCEDLFAAGRLIDEPSAADQQRVALRIAAQVAAAGTAAAVVSLTTAAGSAGTTAATVTKIGTGLSMAKLLVSAAVAVGAVGVVTTAVVKSSGSPARLAQVTTQVTEPPIASAASLPAWSRPHPSMDVPPVEDLPPPVFPAVAATQTAPIAQAAVARKASALPTSEPAETVAPEDTVSEARLVRSIDDAIRRHDGSTAQRLLDEHDATFPHGHFGEECAAAPGARALRR